MDPREFIDEKVTKSVNSQKEYDNNLFYLENLKYRLTGCTTKEELIEEVHNFININDVQGEIHDKLINITNEYSTFDSLYDALVNYLEVLVEDNKKSVDKANDEVKEIREDLLSDAERKGINIVGDREALLEGIESIDDVRAIEEKIEKIDEFNKENSDKEIQITEVKADEIGQAMETPIDQIEATNEKASNQEYDPNSPVQDKGDGTIEIKGDVNNDESMDFVAFMAGVAVLPGVGNDLGGMNLNLDMQLNKEAGTSGYSVTFGNLPVSKMTPDKRVSKETIVELQQRAKEYNPVKDYVQEIAQVSPELSQALMLIDENMFEEDALKFSVKNDTGANNLRMMFATKNNNIASILNENGGLEANKGGYEVSILPPDQQLVALSNAREVLNNPETAYGNSNSMENQQQLSNGLAYVKKFEPPKPNSDQAANVSPRLLIIVTIVELLLIGTYVFIMFNR